MTLQSAPALQPNESTTPTLPADRIWALDALRGLALFGVLAINLDTEFRVSLFEQFIQSPPAGPLDNAVATFLSVALEFKAFGLFSLLFGVGLAIQHDRLARTPHRPVLLIRRLLVLLAFGLVHLFLVWNGDILTEYALAGLFALPLLFMPASASLIAGVLLLFVYAAVPWLPLPFTFPDTGWMINHVAEARHAYGAGGFLDVLHFRVAEVPQIAKLLAYVFPRTLALILIGAWLYRSGAIRRLSLHGSALLLVGLLLIVLGVLCTAQEERYLPAFAVGPVAASVVNVVTPLLVAFGYAALVLAASGFSKIRRVLNWVVPIGRMAFSKYILQSVVLGYIFYGYGFGLMGKVGAALGLSIAVALFAIQAWVSARWLRTHRFGPLEWLWRSLMYGKRQTWGWPGKAGLQQEDLS